MLILTRRINEAFFIGGDVMVMVTDIDGDQVRLGIDAPPATPVVRAELVADKLKISRNFSHDEIFAKMKESKYVWVKDQ